MQRGIYVDHDRKRPMSEAIIDILYREEHEGLNQKRESNTDEVKGPLQDEDHDAEDKTDASIIDVSQNNNEDSINDKSVINIREDQLEHHETAQDPDDDDEGSSSEDEGRDKKGDKRKPGVPRERPKPEANIQGKSVLHMVDLATHFSAASFLKSQSSSEVWKTRQSLWNLVYIGPPDHLSVDQGSNYISREMRANLEAAGVTLHEAPVENPGTIGVVERYHAPLRAAYFKIRADLDRSNTDAECLKLEIFAVNSTMGP